ncbi:MAG: hypothetical protein ACAH22_21195 [Tardiphaga sp.]
MNRIWCARVFSDRAASQRAFGQYLTVSDPHRPAVHRPSIEAALNAALCAPQQAPECVAILGPEGAGKSWLATRWWTTNSDQPILVIGGAQVAHLIDPKDPLGTISRLIAVQGEGDLNEQAERWTRRLRRWRDRATTTASEFRFLLMLDGLNERSGMAWADGILRLSSEVAALGGRLLVTCRERFWEREIAPRLAGVRHVPIKVDDYKPEELDDVLRQSGKNIADISEDVRKFIRNPRICSVALDLLDRLSVQGDELTTERLLLEYWRRRLEERGDLVAHNIRDFDKLLRSHAKALLDNPGVQFDRDDWREHSGAARRGDGRSVEHDLTDIEEGAFLQVVDGRDGFYEFKPDTVPFALGLLVARELQDELRKPDRDEVEVIDGIIEEVQGFDLVGEALRAAAGIACFEVNYAPNARAALISAWLDLQNIPDKGYEALAAYVSACPEAALDAVEMASDVRANSRRREWLLGALLDRRDRPQVSSALKPRIDRWLARWSRTPRRWGGRDEKEEARLRQQAARLSEKLQDLASAEGDFLATVCHEVDTPEDSELDAAAALLLAGRPHADHARGVLAWAFAWSLTEDSHRADKQLCWVIRLNAEDFSAFERNLRGAAEALIEKGCSDVGRKAVAIALRVLGTVAASSDADRLNPRQRSEGWRRVENYCATDPFDPSAARPENLVKAIHEADAIDADKVWNHMSPGEKDWELEAITPGLARFEPRAIVSLLRAVARTIETRRDLALRQLSWHLPRLSPLFDPDTLASVLAGYKRLVAQPSLLAVGDHSHVAGSVLLSLLPHYPAVEQLRLYLELPEEVADWYAFRDVFVPLTSSELEAALEDAEADVSRFKRTLFFVSAHRHDLTDRGRSVLARALEHSDPIVVTYASDLAYVARDDALDEQVIAAARRRGVGVDVCEEAFWRARAVAAAVVSLQRHGDAPLVAPRFLGFVANQLGGTLERKVVDEVGNTFERLLAPIQTCTPKLGRLFLEVDRSGQDTCRRVDDHADEEEVGSIDLLRARAAEMAEPRQGIDTYAERQKALHDEADAYLAGLRAEKAGALARETDPELLEKMLALEPDKALAFAERILGETDQVRLSHVRNLALGLGKALSITNPNRAAALLAHLWGVESPVTIECGDARIPQHIDALFAGPDVQPLSELRQRVLERAATDAALEMLIFAAEKAGHTLWLQAWIDCEAQSCVPGRVARALTVEGLRDFGAGPSLLLARDWGSGFLGHVAERARFAHDRNRWAKEWFLQAAEATDPVDFWRWGELAVGISDVRVFHWFRRDLAAPIMSSFGDELFKRARKVAEKRTKKRKDTLFGIKKPDCTLSELLNLSTK